MALQKKCMIVSMELMMILLLVYCTSKAVSYPSRPLNERSPDMTWQAWILVDDQIQNSRHTSPDGMLRRRITPKSVFIAPTFSPESLPPCASGYSSDQMGRCVKIIELNKTVHEEFILELLKNKFSTDYDYDEEIETEKSPPNGPLQVNIPLDNDDDSWSSEDDDDSDIAIIVSPTRTNFNFQGFNLDKRDSPIDEAQQELLLKKLAETTTKKLDTTTFGKPEQLETSTIRILDEATTKIFDETTKAWTDITSTEENPSTQHIETTTAIEESTMTSITSQTNNDVDIKTTTGQFSTTLGETTTSTTPIQDLKLSTIAPSTIEPPSSTEHTTQTEQLTTFAPKDVISEPALFPKSSPSTYVKFPDQAASTPTQIPASIEFVTNFRVTLPMKQSDEKQQIVFRDEPDSELNLEIANLDYSNGVQAEVTTQASFNRRNRDRNSMFSFPDRWREAHFQKPLVLRFSRKHAYFDSNQFQHPEYYRAIPSDDFAYLFKFKHKPNQR